MTNCAARRSSTSAMAAAWGTSVTVPSRGRCFGLLGSADERVIPYNKIVKFGDDVILVDTGS